MFENLFKAFKEKGHSLFYVGGFVRDYILGKKPKDVDFATSAHPQETIEILRYMGLTPIPIGIEYGTVAAYIDGERVEITTYRCNESYKKGSRKPSVKFGKTINEDLARRDFTFNAMAMDEDFNLVDPFHGHHHLESRHIQTPIDPMVSFSDDPLRMLRACRFASRFSATLELNTSRAMSKLSKEIRSISKERVFEEMSKILSEESPTRGLTDMVSTGLMDQIFPELQTLVEFKTKNNSKNLWQHVLKVIRKVPQDNLIVRWAALFHDVGKPVVVREEKNFVSFYGHEIAGAKIWDRVAKRLKVGNTFREAVKTVILETPTFIDLANPNEEITDKSIRRFVRKVSHNLENIYLFSLADMSTANKFKELRLKTKMKRLMERVKKLEEEQKIKDIKLPKGTGLVISEGLGIKPGKELGIIMSALTQELIDGTVNLKSDFLVEARRIRNGFNNLS